MTDPAADPALPQPVSESTTPATAREHPAGAANESAGGPGARLMAERRAQGLSLGDIARQLKLSVRQVEALERDDHAAFSGAVFVRGFLRNYAKLLHLNPDSLLQQIPSPTPAVQAAAPVVSPVRLPAPETPPRRPRSFGVLGGLAILVVLVLAALYEGRQKQLPVPAMPGALSPSGAGGGPQHAESPPPGLANAPAPQPSTGSSSPISVSGERSAVVAPSSPSATIPPAQDVASTAAIRVQPAPAAPADQPSKPTAAPASKPQIASAASEGRVPSVAERGSAAGAQLHFVFEDESWVEIKDGAGQVIFSQLGRAGSERTVKGNPPLSVIVGNAHGVRLMYREKVVDLGPYTRVDVARLVLE